METDFRIIGGPDKPDLHWAFHCPKEMSVFFIIKRDPSLTRDVVQARIQSIFTYANGTNLNVNGTVTSQPFRGNSFCAQYDVSTRSGCLHVVDRHDKPALGVSSR